eukprot:Gb_17537 [translate_table: standard]
MGCGVSKDAKNFDSKRPTSNNKSSKSKNAEKKLRNSRSHERSRNSTHVQNNLQTRTAPTPPAAVCAQLSAEENSSVNEGKENSHLRQVPSPQNLQPQQNRLPSGADEEVLSELPASTFPPLANQNTQNVSPTITVTPPTCQARRETDPSHPQPPNLHRNDVEGLEVIHNSISSTAEIRLHKTKAVDEEKQGFPRPPLSPITQNKGNLQQAIRTIQPSFNENEGNTQEAIQAIHPSPRQSSFHENESLNNENLREDIQTTSMLLPNPTFSDNESLQEDLHISLPSRPNSSFHENESLQEDLHTSVKSSPRTGLYENIFLPEDVQASLPPSPELNIHENEFLNEDVQSSIPSNPESPCHKDESSHQEMPGLIPSSPQFPLHEHMQEEIQSSIPSSTMYPSHEHKHIQEEMQTSFATKEHIYSPTSPSSSAISRSSSAWKENFKPEALQALIAVEKLEEEEKEEKLLEEMLPSKEQDSEDLSSGEGKIQEEKIIEEIHLWGEQESEDLSSQGEMKEKEQITEELLPSDEQEIEDSSSEEGDILSHEETTALKENFSVDDIISSIAMKEALILEANRDLAKEFQELGKEEAEKLNFSRRSSLDSDHINSLLSWNNQISLSSSPPSYLRDILDQFEEEASSLHLSGTSNHWTSDLDDSHIENQDTDIENLSLDTGDQDSFRSNLKEELEELKPKSPSHKLIYEASSEGIAAST